jgi:1-deoxy-D-xylulose-5-phosphate reductoisomerase
MGLKRIAILGSTGSIGCNTLRVIEDLSARFQIVGLSTNSNTKLLYRQIKRYSPKVVAVTDSTLAGELKKKINKKVKLLVGEQGLNSLVQDKRIDLIVVAISGSFALPPLIRAIEAGKTIALANKESLVMAGSLIMKKAKERNVKIIPIDSEQSAIWQCLEGRDMGSLKKIYLTASGGPLKDIDKRKFRNISIKQVLRHPRWKMGKKITVDSATLMNKGLELIEAMWLFGVDTSQIEVIIHPQAIIHSMVEFIDGSILAQLSITDMRIPIQYALTYPDRLVNKLPSLSFLKLERLTFSRPDYEKFLCLRLAYQAAKAKGTLPCVLNAANESCVDAFLNRKISFYSIPQIIEKVMKRHKCVKRPDIKEIIQAHVWAKKQAQDLIDYSNN